MTAWHRGPMVVFDTETTGVDVNLDRIVTATIARITPGQPLDARSWLLNPGIPIPKAASDVHGVTNQRAHAEGQDPATAVAQIAKAIAAASTAGLPVVAAAEFQTYLRTKKGEKDATVNGEWPVQSLPVGWDPAAVPAAMAVAS